MKLSQIYRVLPIVFFILAITFLALDIHINNTVITERLDPVKFSKNEGHAVIYKGRLRHKTLSDHNGENNSNLKMFENGVEMKSPHALHHEISKLGHGRFSHWDHRLFFSSLDGSDPLTNNSVYTVKYRLYSTTYFWLCVLFICLFLLSFRLVQSFLSNQALTLKDIACHILVCLRKAKYLLLFALALNLAILIILPPLFNGSDTFCFFSWPLKTHFPHWRPAYLLYLRLCNMVVNWDFNKHFFSPTNDTSLYVILIGQHLAYALASTVLAWVVTARKWKRFFLVLIVTISPISFFVNAIFLVSGLIPCALLFIASLISYFKTNDNASIHRKTCLFVGTISLFAAYMMRHDALVLAAMVVFPFLFLFIFKPSKAKFYGFLKSLVYSVALIIITNGLLVAIHSGLGVKRHHIAGRAGIDLLNRDVIDVAERERLKVKMLSQTDDPVYRKAIIAFWDLRGNDNEGWCSAIQQIAIAITPEYPDITVARSVAEDLAGKIFLDYIITCRSHYLSSLFKRLSTITIIHFGASVGHTSITFVDRLPTPSYKHLRGITLKAEDYDVCMTYNPIRKVLSWMSIKMAIILPFFVLLFYGLFGFPRLENFIIFISLAATSVLYAVGNALFQPVYFRMAVMPFFLMFLAVIIAFLSDITPHPWVKRLVGKIFKR